MEKIAKILISLFYIPFIILAFIIAVIRLVWSLTIVFTITISSDLHNKMYKWVDDKIQNIQNNGKD